MLQNKFNNLSLTQSLANNPLQHRCKKNKTKNHFIEINKFNFSEKANDLKSEINIEFGDNAAFKNIKSIELYSINYKIQLDEEWLQKDIDLENSNIYMLVNDYYTSSIVSQTIQTETINDVRHENLKNSLVKYFAKIPIKYNSADLIFFDTSNHNIWQERLLDYTKYIFSPNKDFISSLNIKFFKLDEIIDNLTCKLSPITFKINGNRNLELDSMLFNEFSLVFKLVEDCADTIRSRNYTDYVKNAYRI